MSVAILAQFTFNSALGVQKMPAEFDVGALLSSAGRALGGLDPLQPRAPALRPQPRAPALRPPQADGRHLRSCPTFTLTETRLLMRKARVGAVDEVERKDAPLCAQMETFNRTRAKRQDSSSATAGLGEPGGGGSRVSVGVCVFRVCRGGVRVPGGLWCSRSAPREGCVCQGVVVQQERARGCGAARARQGLWRSKSAPGVVVQQERARVQQLSAGRGHAQSGCSVFDFLCLLCDTNTTTRTNKSMLQNKDEAMPSPDVPCLFSYTTIAIHVCV